MGVERSHQREKLGESQTLITKHQLRQSQGARGRGQRSNEVEGAAWVLSVMSEYGCRAVAGVVYVGKCGWLSGDGLVLKWAADGRQARRLSYTSRG